MTEGKEYDMNDINSIVINNPTLGDLLLAEHGFVLYKEISTPVPDVLFNAKQYIYRRNQGDIIKIEDGKISVVYDQAASQENVTIDTQQDCILFNGFWLSFKEMKAFMTKVQELQSI